MPFQKCYKRTESPCSATAIPTASTNSLYRLPTTGSNEVEERIGSGSTIGPCRLDSPQEDWMCEVLFVTRKMFEIVKVYYFISWPLDKEKKKSWRIIFSILWNKVTRKFAKMLLQVGFAMWEVGMKDVRAATLHSSHVEEEPLSPVSKIQSTSPVVSKMCLWKNCTNLLCLVWWESMLNCLPLSGACFFLNLECYKGFTSPLQWAGDATCTDEASVLTSKTEAPYWLMGVLHTCGTKKPVLKGSYAPLS
jgi:hypothetical protein